MLAVALIYCNRQHGGLWYKLNGEPSAIAATALTGYLKELRFENTERRKKETCKLLVTIQADRTYILESGYDTHFSKCILAAIATLTPEQLYSPVTLQPQAPVFFWNLGVSTLEQCLIADDGGLVFKPVGKIIIAVCILNEIRTCVL